MTPRLGGEDKSKVKSGRILEKTELTRQNSMTIKITLIFIYY